MPKALDLTDRKFGELTALYKVGNGGPGVVWHCKCMCGNEIDVPAYRLTTGYKKSCGCLTHRSQADNIIGRRFGKLIVVERAENIGDYAAWKCKCDCGNETVVTGSNLRSGNTKSCGCLSGTTHGMTHTRLYHVWGGMIQRCTNPNAAKYSYYGGRGIRVCDEWCNSFVAFYEWAMANGYDPELPWYKCTIDRIDVNGNYEPANCRWVDMKTQNNNKSKVS